MKSFEIVCDNQGKPIFLNSQFKQLLITFCSGSFIANIVIVVKKISRSVLSCYERYLELDYLK